MPAVIRAASRAKVPGQLGAWATWASCHHDRAVILELGPRLAEGVAPWRA